MPEQTLIVGGSEIAINAEQMLMLIATLVPEPPKEIVISEMERDRLANPHNDHGKPKRRSEMDIRAELRVKYAQGIEHAVYQRKNPA